MSAASEKAANNMVADLDAMISDCHRHQDNSGQENAPDGSGTGLYYVWKDAKRDLMRARALIRKAMNDRDRKLAGG